MRCKWDVGVMVVLLGVNDRAEVRSADSTAGWRPFVMIMLVLQAQLSCPAFGRFDLRMRQHRPYVVQVDSGLGKA
jgi:hypothetical protein